MKSALFLYRHQQWTMSERSHASFNPSSAQLVLAFGSKQLFSQAKMYEDIRTKFPNAEIALCSTSGEIYEDKVFDDSVSLIAVEFAHTQVKTASVMMKDYQNSFDAGAALMAQLDKENLAYVCVLSDGAMVNGSDLVSSFNTNKKAELLITGGLAADGMNFTSTLVGLNNIPQQGMIVAVALYGAKLKVQHGSKGGWEMFGLEKTVTKSEANVLYEIDGKSALSIYKRYLGEEAEHLPGSALMYPLNITFPETGEQVVRTVLNINEEEGSMTFAGNIPVGVKVKFMKANFDKITNAASEAAAQSIAEDVMPQFALLISCVGRKSILLSRTAEEVESVDEMFQHQTLLSGFYSYGEIAPVEHGVQCQIHNQTMTITSFYEAE